MKKLFVLLLVSVVMLSGCDEKEETVSEETQKVIDDMKRSTENLGQAIDNYNNL